MTPQPTFSAEALIDQLYDRFKKLCRDVAAVVNDAPAGAVINRSEEKVRDLFAVFRTDTYQTAIQLRSDAAQAAFPPSAAPADTQAPPEQRAR